MNVKHYFPNSQDAILIEDFEVLCRVGHTAAERAFPQVVTLSLAIELPLSKSGRSDKMSDTVDYARVINDIKKALSRRPHVLIENVAEKAASAVLRYGPVVSVSVWARKKVFPDIKSVGVVIRREK